MIKLISFLLLSTNLLASETLVEQGNISVNFEDVDGYTLKIPAETRSGFFDSADRLNTTIDTMVKMKHVVRYGLSNGLISESSVEERVKERVIEYAVNIDKELPLFEQEILYKKLSKYLYVEELYREMKVQIKKNIKTDDILQLANEYYIVNKEKYFQVKSYDFDYVNIIYNEDNQKERFQLTKDLKERLYSGEESLKSMSEKNKDEDVVYALNLEKFKFEEKYADFSKFIFKQSKLGVVEEIFDAKNRYIVAVVNNIIEEGDLDFEELKDGIVRKLFINKFDQEFGSLLLKLTKDPIDINRANIDLLKTRYKYKVKT
jgi:hypothetical protein